MRPPRLARWLLSKSLPKGERATVLAEMEVLFRERASRQGRARATRWYLRRAVGFPVRLAGERLRRGPGWPGASEWVRDLRFGARTLARHPAYTLVSLLTLGVGVAALATVYSAAHWVLLRPVPGVAEPDRLATVQLEVRAPGSPAFPMSGPDLETFAGRMGAFTALEASHPLEADLDAGTGAAPRRVSGAAVTAGYLDLLGVVPARGRSVGGVDDEADAVMVGYRLWQELWQGDPGVVGTTVRVNDRPFRVVGVAPRGFRGASLPGSEDLWFPASALPSLEPGLGAEDLTDRGVALWSGMVARLRPGATPEAVRAEAESLMQTVRDEHPGGHSFAADFVLAAYPGLGLAPRARASVRRTLGQLGAVAGALLLLCLVNLGGLAYAHHLGRERTLSLRRALGAGRGRLARGTLFEQFLVGLLGGFAGLTLAAAAHAWLRRADLSSFGASLDAIVLTPRVAAAALAAAVAGALLAGLGPALGAARSEAAGLQAGGRSGGGRRTRRLQSGLVVVQVALSAVLLVGGGLMVRSVMALGRVPLGFDADATVRFSIDPRLHGYEAERLDGLVDELEVRLGEIAGVVSAGFTSPAPVRGSYLTFALVRPGAPDDERAAIAGQLQATPGFLEASGMTLAAGRFLTDADAAAATGGERPILVSRAYAAQLAPGAPPASMVGQVFRRPGGPDAEAHRVVGVLDDVYFTGLRGDPHPLVVVPWGSGWPDGELTGWLRVSGDPSGAGSAVRRVVREVAPGLSAYGIEPVRRRVQALMTEERVVTQLTSAVALVGLFLAALGLHGVLAYAVSRRRREIGVRAALGASPGHLVGAMVRWGLTLAALGAAAGLAASRAAVRLIEGRLFGVSDLDPVSYLAVVALLTVAALVAAWAPARRSVRIPAREALSVE